MRYQLVIRLRIDHGAFTSDLTSSLSLKNRRGGNMLLLKYGCYFRINSRSAFSIFNFKGNGMYLSIHSKYNVKQGNAIPPAGVCKRTKADASVTPSVTKPQNKQQKKEIKKKRSREQNFLYG